MCAPGNSFGFPLYRPPDRKRLVSNASTVVENQTFGAGVTNKYYLCTSIGSYAGSHEFVK